MDGEGRGGFKETCQPKLFMLIMYVSKGKQVHWIHSWRTVTGNRYSKAREKLILFQYIIMHHISLSRFVHGSLKSRISVNLFSLPHA